MRRYTAGGRTLAGWAKEAKLALQVTNSCEGVLKYTTDTVSTNGCNHAPLKRLMGVITHISTITGVPSTSEIPLFAKKINFGHNPAHGGLSEDVGAPGYSAVDSRPM